MSSDRQDKIKLALEAIRKKNGGRLTRAAVVAEARRNKRGVLHGLFDWNVGRAAEAHWLERAGEIIARYVTIITIHKSMVIRSPYYVRDPAAQSNEPGYTALTSAEIDRKQATDIVLTELERCEHAIERARGIAHTLDSRHPGLAGMLQRMLEELVLLKQKLAA